MNTEERKKLSEHGLSYCADNTKVAMLNLDWIAGFFDGEGSCYISVKRGTKRGSGRHRWQFGPRIIITQKDKGILEKIKETLGMGRIIRSRNGNGDLKEYQWYIRKKQDFKKFIALMEERIVLKRRQLLLLKEYITLNPGRKHWCSNPKSLLRALEIALEISKLNHSKKGTIQRISDYIELVKSGFT